VMDITDRKFAEEQLRWQEALMRSMTSVSPLAFFVVDNRTDTILYSNHRFCEIWGIEHLEERIQQGKLKNNDIIPDCLSSLADIPAFAQSCKPLQSEENRVVVEDEIPFADGRKIRRFSTQVRDRQDRYFGRLYIFEDITHRKIAEEALRQSEAREREKAQALERAYSELKRTQAQLIQAEKMSSLGQMVAGIAHEINNPTSFIYGNINPAMEYTQQLLHLVELYRQHYPEPVVEIAEQMELIEPDFIAEDFPKLLASMKEGAQRISQIVLSLRNFSRLDESERKRVEIHEGIDNTLLILKHRLKQQPKRPEIRVINEYGQLPKIECYPGQLNQVFMNIISNAIDALDEATEKDIGFEPTIRICTEVIKSDSRSSHSNEQSVSQVLIRIRDNSPSSIKAELLPKIFDPFFTTKPVGSGTGLGLSISYQIVVDRHRGQLSCYSTPGAGTEFAIELPIAQSVTSH
ncbi:MAG TPA: ATP-binding protein, partial [Oculatellaceae cyanobacterium]